MNKGYTKHSCDTLPTVGVQIWYNHKQLEGPINTWQLHLFREATEQDLEENHELEMTGEIIWSTSVSIRHCPFCGLDLNNIQETKAGTLGEIEHYHI